MTQMSKLQDETKAFKNIQEQFSLIKSIEVHSRLKFLTTFHETFVIQASEIFLETHLN